MDSETAVFAGLAALAVILGTVSAVFVFWGWAIVFAVILVGLTFGFATTR